MQEHIVIIGAGPAGLTAAYLLAKENIKVTVLEADPEYVGGIARTVRYQGYCFDIGGHRFFSKSEEVEKFWTEILPNDFMIRPRSSRIFYNKKFFTYPLKFFEVLSKLGMIQSCLCFLSYLRAKLFPIKNPRSFSDWVKNHFGSRLFNIFFKTYTEKVWGMRCEEISADWAVQRIKGLSFMSALTNALGFNRKDKDIKTLINSFRYPRKGPGMLWEACADKIKQMNGNVLLGKKVIGCQFDETVKKWQVKYQDANLQSQVIEATQIISSAPLKELINIYLPSEKLSNKALTAASALQYRDFLIVVLILKEKNMFADNWIYIHDPSVDVARIQNFKSWSPEMVPDETMCCYGMEYFCFKDDDVWSSNDNVLIEKAKKELIKIGLASSDDIVDGCVVRQVKAYPVYNENYKENVEVIKNELRQKFPNLHIVGRNGMHKYNNQDHAIMTAMLTVKNILAGKLQYDIWGVNQDAEFHESGTSVHINAGLRDVPTTIMS